MDNIPISGLEQLEKHLQTVLETPDTPLDARLFDEVELQLTDGNIAPTIPKILPSLIRILSGYQQDSTILASLVMKLIRPIPFTQVLTLAPEESLILALQSPFPSAVLLGITLLSKASCVTGDTAVLSKMKPVISALIYTWLASPHVAVGEAATKTLGDLLEADNEHGRPCVDPNLGLKNLHISADKPLGQGLLWRRIFQDADIYELFFSLCSHRTTGSQAGQLDKRQKSLGQARLLRLLPRLSVLNFSSLTQSYFPAIEKKYAVSKPGLLYFAAVDMVNKEDLLMHIMLVDFFGELLRRLSMAELPVVTIDYLGALVAQVASTDAELMRSLEKSATHPETSPELALFLARLASKSEYRRCE